MLSIDVVEAQLPNVLTTATVVIKKSATFASVQYTSIRNFQIRSTHQSKFLQLLQPTPLKLFFGKSVHTDLKSPNTTETEKEELYLLDYSLF